ncbi:MAG: hypothetical protein M1830_010403 [Pleopsidium flavum]|nr:MAG: hypothetical protein M1830_010403 [Pleopsidium flavum]
MWFSETSLPSMEQYSKIQSGRVHRATPVTESFPCSGAKTELDWILESGLMPDNWCQEATTLANQALQNPSTSLGKDRSGGLGDASTSQKQQCMPQEDAIVTLNVARARSCNSYSATARPPGACEDDVVGSFSMDHSVPYLAKDPVETIPDETLSTVKRMSPFLSSTLEVPQPIGYVDLPPHADSVLQDWWPHYSSFHETEPSLCKPNDPAAWRFPEMWPYAASCIEESFSSDQSNDNQSFFIHPWPLGQERNVEQHEDKLQDDDNSTDSVNSPTLKQEGPSCSLTLGYATERTTELWQHWEFSAHIEDFLTESVQRPRSPFSAGNLQPPEVTSIRPTSLGCPTPNMTEDFNSSQESHAPSKTAPKNGTLTNTPLHLMSRCHKPILPRPKEVSGSTPLCSARGQKNSDSQNHRRSTAIESAQRQESRDAFLVRSKLAGMSYKQIKEKGQFNEAESTLRGRFRTLTKHKEHRVRKPEWQETDIRLLGKAVHAVANNLNPPGVLGHPGNTGGVCVTAPKIPWKQVAEYIWKNGGSYHFGNATCRKKWDETSARNLNKRVDGD